MEFVVSLVGVLHAYLVIGVYASATGCTGTARDRLSPSGRLHACNSLDNGVTLARADLVVAIAGFALEVLTDVERRGSEVVARSNGL